jgi:hypothetical protein
MPQGSRGILHFPVEIWDLVIGLLHDDRASLRACALVCHAWLQFSQSHLFHSMELRCCITTFNLFLAQSPHIMPYIKSLTFNSYIFWSHIPHPLAPYLQRVVYRHVWCASSSAARSCGRAMGRMRRLDTLVLEAPMFSRAAFACLMRSLPPLVKVAISDIVFLEDDNKGLLPSSPVQRTERNVRLALSTLGHGEYISELAAEGHISLTMIQYGPPSTLMCWRNLQRLLNASSSLKHLIVKLHTSSAIIGAAYPQPSHCCLCRANTIFSVAGLS